MKILRKLRTGRGKTVGTLRHAHHVPKINMCDGRAKDERKRERSTSPCVVNKDDYTGTIARIEFTQESFDIVDDDDEFASESSDNDDVNYSNYSLQACALAACVTDPFDELGHEDQFFGVTRFEQR